MKKYIHGKTLALILAATTTLQLTGVTYKLLNGVPFITANATTGEGSGYLVEKVEIPQGIITSDGSNYSLLKPLSLLSVPTTLEVNTTIVGTGSITTTGPAVVRIVGTERVGKSLEAELLKSDGREFTTSAGVVYKWYRLDHKSDDISEGTLVEDEKTYKLVAKDKNNYIKLLVTYNGNTFTDITGDIDRRSRSHNSSSDDDDDDDATENNKNNNIKEAHLEKDKYGNLKIIENGLPANGWKQLDGKWYLADSLGNVQTGWKQVNNDWYLLNNDGVMATGWQQVGGLWYLLNNDGVMATGWQQVGGLWYLLNNDGGMLTGWQLVGGKWYLLNPNGAMATGWQQSNGKWYYLYEDGSMANATVIDGYRVDMTGAWIK